MIISLLLMIVAIANIIISLTTLKIVKFLISEKEVMLKIKNVTDQKQD